MEQIKILEDKIKIEEVKELAKSWYGQMIKGSVDIERRLVALGGDYHIKSCKLLVADGSRDENVWGFNIRFGNDNSSELEFDSFINIKPKFGNSSRLLSDPQIIFKATEIIKEFIELS